MAVLAVDKSGRITLGEDLLQHLDVNPGDKIEIVKLPHERIEFRAVRQARPVSEIFGSLTTLQPSELSARRSDPMAQVATYIRPRK